MGSKSFDTSGRIESEQERKVRLAKERQELRQEGKREKFLSKHPELRPDCTKTQWIEGRESPTLGINQTEGVKLGRKDAVIRETDWTLRVPGNFNGHAIGNYGRISKQSPTGHGESAGFNAQSYDFWKARFLFQEKGKDYKRISVEKAEIIQSERMAAYLEENPSWDPEKAKLCAKTKAKQRKHDENRGIKW